jgi:hypothetical protein
MQWPTTGSFPVAVALDTCPDDPTTMCTVTFTDEDWLCTRSQHVRLTPAVCIASTLFT